MQQLYAQLLQPLFHGGRGDEMKRLNQGPGVRSKAKKPRHGANDVYEALRQVMERGYVTEDDVSQLYHVGRPACQGCRTNTRDNPNCFCGLVPPVGSLRNQGLWKKVPDAVRLLGEDPSNLRRAGADPVGLMNLQATCYMNSVVQCLYMIEGFRRGVFEAEAELLRHFPVVRELGRVFAELQAGRQAVASPADLAAALQLNSGVQQDGQEFMDLLLSHLKDALKGSRSPAVHSLVQDLFRGTFSYVTRCLSCGCVSDSSEQLEDFYQLVLNLKGFASLEESLGAYLKEERLDGENQYFCEHCRARTDAVRCVKLRTLPPVLNFQLMRFIYNAKAASKKKVTSRFAFPYSINLGPVVSGTESSRAPSHAGSSPAPAAGATPAADAGSALYELTAVVVHKGSLASSGHYIGHIKDVATGKWWKFDDEQVTGLDQHPLGDAEPGSGGAGAPDDQAGSSGARQSAAAAEPRRLEPAHAALAEANESTARLTSGDAYMLIYTQQGLARPGGGNLRLSEHLLEEVERKNANFDERCRKFDARRAAEAAAVLERQHEVRRVLGGAPAGGDEAGGGYCWISWEWLKGWADGSLPSGAIDNSPLLCSHSRLSPAKLTAMKRISLATWELLHSKYGGGPRLDDSSDCSACILEAAEHAHIRRLIDEQQSLSGSVADGKASFLISRSWLAQWKKRAVMDPPSEADAAPTAALECTHGSLLPEHAPGAKRQAVSGDVWGYLRRLHASVAGEGARGDMPFPVGTEECTLCEVEFLTDAAKQDELRQVKLEQKQRHEELLSRRSLQLLHDNCYYLLPTAWLEAWRAYVATNGKNTVAVAPPQGLAEALQTAKCTKHGGLVQPVPKLGSSRGKIFQRAAQDDVFTVVSASDWQGLAAEYGAGDRHGIRAMLASPSCARTDIVTCGGQPGAERTLERVIVIGGKLDLVKVPKKREARAAAGKEIEFDQVSAPQLITVPEVCDDCRREQRSIELAQKLDFSDKEITVELVTGKAPPPSMLATTASVADAERRSRRPRKASALTGGRVALRVSANTTVRTLKLQLWEAFGIVKENQRVGFGDKELDSDDARLADFNVVPDSRLWVVNTGQHENRDIAEDLPDEEGGSGETEEGFKGTCLLGPEPESPTGLCLQPITEIPGRTLGRGDGSSGDRMPQSNPHSRDFPEEGSWHPVSGGSVGTAYSETGHDRELLSEQKACKPPEAASLSGAAGRVHFAPLRAYAVDQSV